MAQLPATSTDQRICPQCAASLAWPDYTNLVVCPSCTSTLAADAALRAVQCPQCAGPLAAVGGLRLLACCHCGVHVLVAPQGGNDRWRLPLRVDRPAAERVAREWLQSRPDVHQPSDGVSFEHAELVYLPIWEYGALVAGWEFGYHTRMQGEFIGDEQNERMELSAVREEVQEGRLQERRFYLAAADPAAVGAGRPRITGREPLIPVLGGDLDEARVLPEQGTAAHMVEQGRRRVLEPTSRVENPDSRLLLVRESACLLFYPLWVLAGSDTGGRYSVVVNGFEGTVNAAVAPLRATARLRERGAKAAPLGVPVLLLLGLALLSASARLPAAILLVMALVVAAAVFWQACIPSEVEYHDPYSS